MSSNAVANIIPQNLILSDASSIAKKQKKEIPYIQYYFPIQENGQHGKLEIKSFLGTSNPEVTSFNVDPRVFNVALRKDIVHEVIRFQRNKIRQPHKTKRIGEIAGSTKKPRPQKGGGVSRAGNRRSSIWRGGQKAHGPVLRDFSIRLNRKYLAMGTMIALAAKYRENNLLLVEKFDLPVFSLCNMCIWIRSLPCPPLLVCTSTPLHLKGAPYESFISGADVA